MTTRPLLVAAAEQALVAAYDRLTLGPRPWWIYAAFQALERGHMHAIGQRSDHDALYLVRFWLTPPSVDIKDAEKWESSDSALLHFFAAPDDDQALHDHPWSFRTTILAGGYVEHLPPDSWLTERVDSGCEGSEPPCGLGPAWDDKRVRRDAGDVVEHTATDLHCVGAVDAGTWTFVATGMREREWGFHPPGQVWVPWRRYLGIEQPAAAAGHA